MKNYWSGVIGLTKAYLLRFTRDKTSLFFTFLFPLIFLFVFGSIFNSQDSHFSIAIVNKSETEFAKGFVQGAKEDKGFKVELETDDVENAKEKLARGEVSGIIELPKTFGEVRGSTPAGNMIVHYQKGSEQTGRMLSGVLQGVLDEINKNFGQKEPPFMVKEQVIGKKGLSQFDYTISGLLAFTILSMTLFGLANGIPSDKKNGAFRRLRASPLRKSQVILGNGFYYGIITLLSLLTMVIVASLLFKFNMRGDWLIFSVYAVLSTVMLLGFGLLVGGWAKNENQSAPISNLVSFPMMFLSGVFFPRFLFPEWLQGITNYIPLTPVADGFRRIMTENASLLELAPQLAVMGAWTIVVYMLAIKLFRWE